ncbi:FAD-dependent oxidoreductase [Paenibacillus koleovorans]|uniref:FAD-dependent oxidoreductase n=1 Tax=Paenibacillus koleovorans TaxID=121608 RepID=UPI0013E34603|nr:FAD-dependent oxidoreductase [Paenibacillus koleovorans]
MEFNKDLKVLDEYDVVVCGGGPSGIPAALAAARAGLRVLLIEATGQLGGVGTSAGVSHLLGARTQDQSRQVCVAGIFTEITEELARRGGAIHPLSIKHEKYSPHGWSAGLAEGVPFDPVQMTLLLDEKMLDAGVDILYFTQFVDVVVKDERITHVVAFNKSGLFSVPVKAVIDATGDGDVAARSGCTMVKGREEDGLMTPASLIFHVENVDQDATREYIEKHESNRFREIILELREKGEWTFPYEIMISVQLHEVGTMMINTTRICDVDGTDGRSISKGMMQGRREVNHLFNLLRTYFPGFENCKIRSVAPVLGIRETRRIVGDYVMTVADVATGNQFPDTIGFSGYGWDLPDPKRPSYQPMYEDQKTERKLYTPIPYRVLVPNPIRNVICPGRAISVERHVLGPLREQGPCYAMGQAAGVAASMVIRDNGAFQTVDTDELRAELRRLGAKVDWEPQPVAAN